jgi:hypothetical protein
MPNSLAREICWLSAGRIPQERIPVKILCIASRRGPGSSDDDSWITLQSMGCQIGSPRINLQGLYTPSVWFRESNLCGPDLLCRYQANEFRTSIPGKAASHCC